MLASWATAVNNLNGGCQFQRQTHLRDLDGSTKIYALQQVVESLHGAVVSGPPQRRGPTGNAGCVVLECEILILADTLALNDKFVVVEGAIFTPVKGCRL